MMSRFAPTRRTGRLPHRGARLGLGIALALAACAEGPVCTPAPVASLPLLDEPTGLYIAAIIDHHPVKLLLDTGGARSLLTSETVYALRLHTEHLLDDTDVLRGVALEGVGGRRHIDLAWTHLVELGELKILGEPFAVVLSRNTGWSADGDGILGIDLLARYDLDLDLGHHRLALYEPGSLCLSTALHATRMLQDMAASGPIVGVLLRGETLTALIDTGAQRSYIMAHSAERFHVAGWREQAAGHSVDVIGVGSGHTTAMLHEAAPLSIGGIDLPPARFAVVRSPALAHLDIILGEDILRTVHAWISATSHRVTLELFRSKRIGEISSSLF